MEYFSGFDRKVFWIGILILLFAVCGCVNKGKRIVTQESMICTESPAIQIDIDEKYTYLGEKRNDAPENRAILSTEIYAYADTDATDKAISFLTFEFSKADRHFRWNERQYYDIQTGKATIDGVQFKTAIHVNFNKPQPEALELLRENGITLAGTYFTKIYSRVVRHGYLCQLVYWEIIDPKRADQLFEWRKWQHKTNEPLRDELQKIVNDFAERADAVMGSLPEQTYWYGQ